MMTVGQIEELILPGVKPTAETAAGAIPCPIWAFRRAGGEQRATMASKNLIGLHPIACTEGWAHLDPQRKDAGGGVPKGPGMQVSVALV